LTAKKSKNRRASDKAREYMREHGGCFCQDYKTRQWRWIAPWAAGTREGVMGPPFDTRPEAAEHYNETWSVK
jgi:hypothetical protein